MAAVSDDAVDPEHESLEQMEDLLALWVLPIVLPRDD